MKMRKILAMVMALALTAALAVGGTLAYLTSTTQQIENVFSVGNITATLAETVANNGFKIVPGNTEKKDPTITIEEKSEKCYVYAYIDNQLLLTDGTVASSVNINTSDWIRIEGTTNNGKALYRYKEIVDAATADQVLPVFTQVTYLGDVINDQNIDQLKDKTITVQGYAYQSENVDQTTADNAAKAKFGFTTGA